MWILLALLSAAAAEPETDPPVSDEPPESAPAAEAPAVSAPPTTWPDDGREVEQVIVYGDLLVEQARRELDASLRGMGYRAGISKGDRVVYRPEVPWKPSVVLFDDGLVALRRSPVRLGMGKDVSPWFHLLCPIMPTSCIKAGGQVISPRKLDAAKEDVLAATADNSRALTEALVDRANAARIDALPQALYRLWDAGTPMDGGAPLADPAERRAATLELWATRTCTPEGDAVADAIAAFVRGEIQGSGHPAPPDELAAAEARSSCGRSLTRASANSP